MTIPGDFPYRNAYLHGRPAMSDGFLKKHPPMSRGHRAKIFAPFDALDGFDETLDTKNIRYVPKEILSEAELETIDRRLRILASLTGTGEMARQNRVEVTLIRYLPCADIYHGAYAQYGTYETVSGVVWEVDEVERSLLVGETRVGFDAISRIESPVFAEDGE